MNQYDNKTRFVQQKNILILYFHQIFFNHCNSAKAKVSVHQNLFLDLDTSHFLEFAPFILIEKHRTTEYNMKSIAKLFVVIVALLAMFGQSASSPAPQEKDEKRVGL